MNTLLQFIGGAIIIIFLLSIVIGWIIYLVQWIVCRKKQSCEKDCIFKMYCINKTVSRKAQLEQRKAILEKMMKDKLNEEQ